MMREVFGKKMLTLWQEILAKCAARRCWVGASDVSADRESGMHPVPSLGLF